MRLHSQVCGQKCARHLLWCVNGWFNLAMLAGQTRRNGPHRIQADWGGYARSQLGCDRPFLHQSGTKQDHWWKVSSVPERILDNRFPQVVLGFWAKVDRGDRKQTGVKRFNSWLRRLFNDVGEFVHLTNRATSLQHRAHHVYLIRNASILVTVSRFFGWKQREEATGAGLSDRHVQTRIQKDESPALLGSCYQLTNE